MPDEKETFGSWRTRIGRDRALCSCWESSVRRQDQGERPEPVRSEKSLALVTPLCEECLDLNTERWRGAHGDASDAQLSPATDILVASAQAEEEAATVTRDTIHSH